MLNRAEFIGGSEIYNLFNTEYSCKRKIWYEKAGKEKDFIIPENEAMKRGKLYEPVIVEKYKEKTGNEILKRNERITVGKLSGEVDGLALDKNGVKRIVECKCPRSDNFKKIKETGIISDSWTIQGQVYCGLFSSPVCDYAIFSYTTTDVLIFSVAYDADMFALILDKINEFYKLVDAGQRPKRREFGNVCKNCEYCVTCLGINYNQKIREEANVVHTKSVAELIGSIDQLTSAMKKI